MGSTRMCGGAGTLRAARGCNSQRGPGRRAMATRFLLQRLGSCPWEMFIVFSSLGGGLRGLYSVGRPLGHFCIFPFGGLILFRGFYWPCQEIAGTEVLLLLGGVGLRRYFNDVWRSVDGGETWAQVASQTPFAPRAATATAVTSSGLLLLAGGRGEDTYFSDIWVSSDVGSTWAELTWEGASPLPLSGASLVLLQNDTFLLLGGFDGKKHCNQVWQVSVSKNRRDVQWKSLPKPGWQPRYCHRAVLLGESLIILTGGGLRYYRGTFTGILLSGGLDKGVPYYRNPAGGYGLADGDFGDTWTSPCLHLLQRKLSTLRLLGRSFVKRFGITSEVWTGAVLPCLLPHALTSSKAESVLLQGPTSSLAQPALQKHAELIPILKPNRDIAMVFFGKGIDDG